MALPSWIPPVTGIVLDAVNVFLELFYTLLWIALRWSVATICHMPKSNDDKPDMLDASGIPAPRYLDSEAMSQFVVANASQETIYSARVPISALHRYSRTARASMPRRQTWSLVT